MKRLNRRDVIASLAATATLAAGRAHAECDTWRDTIGTVPTKSYQCDVGAGGGVLTTTFLRLSDVMFDSAGTAPLPGAAGAYQGLVSDHRLIPTPALNAFQRLFEAHSFAFEPENIEIAYDMRGNGLSGQETIFSGQTDLPRWRTLGVWDETLGLYRPAFPLPDLLRQSLSGSEPSGQNFLRYAERADFEDLDDRIARYLDLWSSHSDIGDATPGFGNLALLSEIDAGSVPEFVPIFFEPGVSGGGCDGVPSAGAYYVPPALQIDVVVCRNDGAVPITIEDAIGAVDATESLRPYDPTTPPGAERLGWPPTTLAPGESLMAVQRLLFGALPTYADGDDPIPTSRAVYAPTGLPKGVLVDGQATAFEGRSHNAVILASFANCCCCPYLESWCTRSGEWIDHGKMLAGRDAPEKAGAETRRFGDVRTRFRLSEREHEDTYIDGATLEVTLEDGTIWATTHPGGAALTLSIGESRLLDFAVPAKIAAKARGSALTLRGHYVKFAPDRLAKGRPEAVA